MVYWGEGDSLKNGFDNKHVLPSYLGLPSGSDSKESDCSAGDLGSIPGLERSPGEGNGWLPTPIFLPGEFHEQRSLAGYSPWGCKDLDTTEWQTLALSYSELECKHSLNKKYGIKMGQILKEEINVKLYNKCW